LNANEIGEAVTSGQLTVSDGIAALEKIGYEHHDAVGAVFIALGGDDVIDDANMARVQEAKRRMRELRH
jgi:hypothetical protein